jgi:two-component system chemotaxis response regulator CheB
MPPACDPFVAAGRIREQIPDVIILDIEMPRMDGLTFLRKIMAQHPIPVIICSTLTEAGSATTLEALEAGAIEVIGKPRIDSDVSLREAGVHFCDIVKAAALADLRGRQPRRSLAVEAKLTADVMMPPPRARANQLPPTDRLVCIGASTGGTEALREVLETLPADAPGIAVVQHMPERFTAAFAKRLNGICAIEIKEAADGDDIIQGRVLIAPGNRHMLLQRNGGRYRVVVKEGPLVSRHRPSVDVLFRSAAHHAGANALGIIMTGMGDDGARGLLEMRNAGAHTLAQNEETCVIFGMPREAIARGAAQKTVPLGLIASEIVNFVHAR